MQHLIGGEGALSGLAADSDLGGQQSEAKGQCQNDIGQQENAAAVLGCQIGKAPDVAQTYSRACCCKNKADVSRMISILEEKGFVEKKVVGGSLYRGLLVLTEKGKEFAEKNFTELFEMEKRVFEKIVIFL